MLNKSYTRLAALDSVKWSLGLSLGYFFSPIILILLTGSEISGNYLARQLIKAIAMLPFIFIIIFISKFFSYKNEYKKITSQNKSTGNNDEIIKGNSNISDIISKIEVGEISEIEEKERKVLFRKKITYGIACAVILFLIFVWPTQYRYENAPIHGKNYLIRINRITMNTAMLTSYGWEEMHKQERSAETPHVEAPAATPAPAATAAPVEQIRKGTSFDINGARKEGYSDREIADYLASQKKFDIAAARNNGYSDQEIINHLIVNQEEGLISIGRKK